VRASGFETALRNLLRIGSEVAGFLVVGIGVAVLVGWEFDISFLIRVREGFIGMNPVTAVLFVIAGVSLIRFARQRSKAKSDWVPMAGGGIILLIAVLKWAEYLFELELHIDQLLFRGKAGSALDGRDEIALMEVISFLLIGPALIVYDLESKRGFRPAQTLILGVAFIALLALLGYCYQALSA